MKRLRFNILTMGLISGAMLFTGCKDSFLEQEPPTKATLETYFNTEDHILEQLTAVYVPAHMYDYNTAGGYTPLNFSDILGDDYLTGAAGPSDQEQWHRAGNYTLSGEMTLHGYWAMSYDGIKVANETIYYLEQNKDKFSAEFYNRVKCEASIMRAFYYSIVWKWFGNIPVYFNVLKSDDKVAQSPAAEAYEKIIDDLEKTIEAKGVPMFQDENNLGRATQAMAYMIYADMVLYQNDNARFQKAANFMKEIIDDGHYSLNPDFANLWSPDGEWCSESIFEINYTDGSICERGYDNIAAIGGTWLPQVCGPDGGVKSDGDVIGDGWGTCIPRRTALALYDAADKRTNVTFIDCAPGNARYQNQDLFNNKYAPRKSHVAVGTGGANHCRYNDNFRYYRFAETLLNAAELVVRGATIQSAKVPNNKDLLNLVRQRAGVPDLDLTLDNIIAERRLEFMGEGKRYWDLVRMEDVPESSVKASTVLVPDANPVNEKGDAGRTGTWNINKKYIPIDAVEISSAQGSLTQNNAYFN